MKEDLDFLELDLVGHDGGDAAGEFAQTINAVDVYTGWNEPSAFLLVNLVYRAQGSSNEIKCG
ncbi:hypothetical protein HKBW3S06_01293 [Candidatus Hakubella thermalkaliphila]|uniref:Uncharacterized protein n=1 Tax=Candidatus Hakubella thermalkaliphila TaxID=2754717 RepID=A0A6V8NU96_9ACTN|nr:hypothetical protein [Candidatus Hakubella thermalkaliphila]GFP22066.1 hypothetical protein HKBW3S06_01293 [Candidatus Hakubella thermalkaliphila]